MLERLFKIFREETVEELDTRLREDCIERNLKAFSFYKNKMNEDIEKFRQLGEEEEIRQNAGAAMAFCIKSAIDAAIGHNNDKKHIHICWRGESIFDF